METEVDAALPFLSFFAGLLVAADLVRSTQLGYPQVPNFAAFDFGAGFGMQLLNREPMPSCACLRSSRDLWRDFNQNARLGFLVE